MKKFFLTHYMAIIFWTLVFGVAGLIVWHAYTRPTPPDCVVDAPNEPGTYARLIGTVKFADETCQVYDVYDKIDCSYSYGDLNKKCTMHCRTSNERRVTKCPTQIISREPCGKNCFHEETIK